MLISVCIPTIRADTLPSTVAAIRAQTWSDWELIIIPQCADERLVKACEAAAEADSRVHCIYLDQRGLSLAENAGIREASGELLAFTADDCAPAPDWLERIHESFVAQPSVGIVAGDLLPSPRPRWRWPSTCPATRTIEYLHRPSDPNVGAPPGFYWAGANFAARREVFDLISGFDEYLGPGAEFPAAEDVDFALRAESAGIAVWTRPSIIVHHTYGRRYGVRNMLMLYRSYARGSGALGGKLKLLDHRLSHEWGQKRGRWTTILRTIKNPARTLLDRYKGHYCGIATRQYLAEFELDERGLSRPKSGGVGHARAQPPQPPLNPD